MTEPDFVDAADALTDFVALLWDEREHLDRLCAALSGYARAQRTGDPARAELGREVDELSGTLALIEVSRATTSTLLAQLYERDAGATLRELSEVVIEPWATILAEHRQALRPLARQLAELAAATGTGVWQRSLAEFLR